MKFSTLVTLSLTAVSSTLAAPMRENLFARALSPGDSNCIPYFKYEGIYHSTYEQSCVNLVRDCKSKVVNTTSDIWGVKSCVAAATCQGVIPLIAQIQCTEGGSVPDAPETESLDYNIYAGIVGDCAWQEGGCPITQQNYIDFIYGALSEIGTTSWPNRPYPLFFSSVDNVITNWWDYLKVWTATGETVPYLNLNDWLHYSNSS
ncbi:hypothetical protein K435DRAFT_747036 [Dendrothele bispora CBS 962.96]|uniref:Uncharacterized protein n=1 Tax=Dendrothele bispora (strain CBS 962.96) TaxID=1314807 RepID=A0A4S8MMX1_DENBC|nr:hypothetical protein K435DRAFT_747036 [Dendrothele bispora CBS 962.96]